VLAHRACPSVLLLKVGDHFLKLERQPRLEELLIVHCSNVFEQLVQLFEPRVLVERIASRE
jgi:hypothetical protein